ncbi:hypothetical protein DFH07DRAFT_855079 [Mycena maculata]|uniref:Uncharacterized protein n=1 Tax=Mycena maculata TaxID=230809 RepID=A0AAD7HNS9_9AGAR|nr:hypothetical protein DFH07DRAFT_855079 [Mycena maculata]
MSWKPCSFFLIPHIRTLSAFSSGNRSRFKPHSVLYHHLPYSPELPYFNVASNHDTFTESSQQVPATTGRD